MIRFSESVLPGHPDKFCDLVADADSATFCLSKGLAAPIGSVVVGSNEFISRRTLRNTVASFICVRIKITCTVT